MRPRRAVIRETPRARRAPAPRRWLLVTLAAVAVLAAPVPLPGPNVIGYYFTFRVVGHLLAVRGARHGLGGVLVEPRGAERPSSPSLGRARTTCRRQSVAARRPRHRRGTRAATARRGSSSGPRWRPRDILRHALKLATSPRASAPASRGRGHRHPARRRHRAGRPGRHHVRRERAVPVPAGDDARVRRDSGRRDLAGGSPCGDSCVSAAIPTSRSARSVVGRARGGAVVARVQPPPASTRSRRSPFRPPSARTCRSAAFVSIDAGVAIGRDDVIVPNVTIGPARGSATTASSTHACRFASGRDRPSRHRCRTAS